MEIIEDMMTNIGREKNGSSNSFKPVDGAIFCQNCGKMYKEDEVDGKCVICNNEDFISGEFASTLAGYILLDKKAFLKKYYKDRYRKSSSINMNNNRIVIRLLIMDRLLDYNDLKMTEAVMRVLSCSKKEMRNGR